MKNKTYNFRIYPNLIQEIRLAKTFGCCRFLYNQMLGERIKNYKNKTTACKTEKDYKHQFDFLAEVDSVALQQSRLNLQHAYTNFFRRIKTKTGTGFPNFKSKHNRQSYRTVAVNNNLKVDFENKKIKLPKIGWINYKDSRQFSVPVRSITVSKNKAGNYFASILVQENIEQKPLAKNQIALGIDLGIDNFATLSTGEQIKAPKYFSKSEKKLVKQQKSLSRKTKGSQNRNKQRIKVANIYQKIRNQKTDFLQKLSSRIIDENQVIVIEDLSIKKMLQNKYLSKNIHQSNWYQFHQMLKYKANWYGRQIEVVDKYFPSSQLCSSCGYRNENLKLSQRMWLCPTCGTTHDRDINAAKNLANTVGTTEINACGGKPPFLQRKTEGLVRTTIVDSEQESTSFRA